MHRVPFHPGHTTILRTCACWVPAAFACLDVYIHINDQCNACLILSPRPSIYRCRSTDDPCIMYSDNWSLYNASTYTSGSMQSTELLLAFWSSGNQNKKRLRPVSQLWTSCDRIETSISNRKTSVKTWSLLLQRGTEDGQWWLVVGSCIASLHDAFSSGLACKETKLPCPQLGASCLDRWRVLVLVERMLAEAAARRERARGRCVGWMRTWAYTKRHSCASLRTQPHSL
jgi:hypothetical protein